MLLGKSHGFLVVSIDDGGFGAGAVLGCHQTTGSSQDSPEQQATEEDHIGLALYQATFCIQG